MPVHMRIDTEELNSKRRFACGIGPELPEGDTYIFQAEGWWHNLITCRGCICSPHDPYADVKDLPKGIDKDHV